MDGPTLPGLRLLADPDADAGCVSVVDWLAPAPTMAGSLNGSCGPFPDHVAMRLATRMAPLPAQAFGPMPSSPRTRKAMMADQMGVREYTTLTHTHTHRHRQHSCLHPHTASPNVGGYVEGLYQPLCALMNCVYVCVSTLTVLVWQVLWPVPWSEGTWLEHQGPALSTRSASTQTTPEPCSYGTCCRCWMR